MFTCDMCNKQYTSADSLRQHKYRSKKGLLGCKHRADKRRVAQITSQIDPQQIIEAVEKKQKHEKDEETLQDLKEMVSTLIQQNNDQKQENKEQLDKLSRQNEELKEIMVDMQKNPRLLMICNHLNPIEQLNLREPEFRPVLEILDKELPEYANLASSSTGRVHAKAVQKINTIKPTAVEEGGDIFYKTENVLSKDTADVTTKAFIDAIGALGYEYARKAIGDLNSERETDRGFQDEVLQNAKKDSIPKFNGVR